MLYQYTSESTLVFQYVTFILAINFDILHFSKFLYELTRHDGHNPSESVLRRWIEAIASKLGVSLKDSEHIRTILIRRSNYLKGKVKAFIGSAKRMQFLQQEWELKLCEQNIEFSEMESRLETLEDEVEELHHEVSHAAQDIQELRNKRDELQEREKELTASVSRLQKDNQRLQAKARELSATTACSTPRTRGRSYKPEEEYSESHKRRLKRQRTKSCSQSLSWLEDQGFIPLTVMVRSVSAGKEATHLCDHDMLELFGQSSDMDNDTLDTVNMMLYIKDWYNISDGAYHELAKVCKEMPRQYRLRERITNLNKLWKICPTPNNTQGVQQSLKDRLKIRISNLIKTSCDPNSPFMQEKLIRVKLSGDGTKIGKRLHVIAFTFTLLDEHQATSANHILAVFKQPESYEYLKLALADIIDEVEHLKEIEVEGLTFSIAYYLGGDWKFLALVTGIDSASSDHACIWCKCKKDERCDIQREWSLSDK